MFDFIREHQLNLMLVLCGACSILILLLAYTRFLPKSRKRILIFMEAMAVLLLGFDRTAYIYSGNTSLTGYVMVRLSNFFVFFLTSGLVLGLNLYISDWLMHEGKLDKQPILLKISQILSLTGMALSVIAAFTDLYYYFDETNIYHRGPGFLIAYIIPIICPIMQFIVVVRHRKVFGKLIFYSIILYVFVPLLCGITQIFTYGISIVNMAMVAVSISMYIFMYLDLNNTVAHAHQIEILNMQGEQERMQKLFDKTASAFVASVEEKDELTKGYFERVAKYARQIASNAGKSASDCGKIYYAALLHDSVTQEMLPGMTGLDAADMPEVSKIIKVANDYVSMTSKQKDHDELPRFVARENFVKGAGDSYDPAYADIMVKIIDAQSNDDSGEKEPQTETELTCNDYRKTISRGISIETDIKRISFECELSIDPEKEFSAPSLILFDSYDGRAHDNEKTIESYHYLEYCEIWFDKYSVSTAARNIEEKEIDDKLSKKARGRQCYEILAGRCEDHLRLIMRTADYAKEVIIALPSRSKAAYIGLTGENCRIEKINIETTGDTVLLGDIPRIAQPVSYIDHLESDLKNIQIDRWMSDSTDGVEIDDHLKLSFHTMSLPEADLIWHCPYIVLFWSEDGRIGGKGYREYNLIKLNGEDQGDKEFAKNRFVVKRTPAFPGWDRWKEVNKGGLEVEVNIERKGKKVILRTENLGISIENTTIVTDDKSKVFVSLSGDQVALTDIRID